jgi:serine/threonine protein kinase
MPRGRYRPWLLLIGAAIATAAVGWYSHGRAAAAAEAGDPQAVVDALTEGFWILFALFALLGVGVIAGGYVGRVLGRTKAHDQLQLGQYTLEEKLGEGAMGAVYRARHALLRRPTAIKLLRVERQSDTRALQRFEREVQQTSRLMHPNTVAVYDFGHTREGVFYYAMEYIEGTTLERLVDQFGPLPPERAIYVLKQVCGSLAEAHGMGLVHRDIKPSNIMLCEQGGEHDVVKVVDFGLVKDATDASSSLTMGDALAGTPLYASPEAIRSSDAVEPRSDLYAVGAVGYFLLTGMRVFDGETVMEVCTKHLSEQPQRPSDRADVAVPRDLEDLIMACLEKEPADRPASARILRDSLVACAAHALWGQAEAYAWWEQHRAALSAPREGAGPPALPFVSIDLASRTRDAD